MYGTSYYAIRNIQLGATLGMNLFIPGVGWVLDVVLVLLLLFFPEMVYSIVRFLFWIVLVVLCALVAVTGGLVYLIEYI